MKKLTETQKMHVVGGMMKRIAATDVPSVLGAPTTTEKGGYDCVYPPLKDPKYLINVQNIDPSRFSLGGVAR